MDDQKVRMELDWVSGPTKGAEGAKQVRKATDDVKRGLEELGPAAEKAENKMAGVGKAGLQAGYALQDLAQGGIPAVLNNVTSLAQSLGLGPGLAGALVIAGTAAFVFKDQLLEAAQAAGFMGEKTVTLKSQIEDLKTKIAELGKTPGKLNFDMNQLNDAIKKMDDLEKRLAAFNAGRTTAEMADLGARAMKAGRETMGSEGLKKAVFDINRATGVSAATGAQDLERAELKERGERLQRMATEKSKFTGRFLYGEDERADFQAKADAVKKVLMEIQASIDAADIAMAESTVGGFLAGDIGEIGRMKGRAAKHPGAFTPEFRKEAGKLPSTPEEWTMMREGAKASAKESADLTREAEMTKKDTADRKEQAKIAETARLEKLAADKEDERTKHAATQDVLKAARERVKATAERAKELGEGDIDEVGAARAAGLRAGTIGGKMTARGMMPAAPGAQQEMLSKAMGQDIARAMPGLSEEDQAQLVEKMVRDAFKQADEKNALGRLADSRLSDKTFSTAERASMAQDIALATAQALIERVEALDMKMARSNGEALRLMQRARGDANPIPAGGH